MHNPIVDEEEYYGVTIALNFSGLSDEQWSKFGFKISICNEGEEDLINVGKGEGYILENPSGYDSLVEISDDISQEIYNLCTSLDPDLFKNVPINHVVIIESIEIDENYRKKGLGLKTMNILLTFFKGDLIVIVPCPITGTYPPQHEDFITEKLRKHWMKCGFKQIGDKDIFYF
jgi:hypothetical protein